MSVGRARLDLVSAAKRYAAFVDDESLSVLEKAAERFAYEKKHARSRRERWKERRITKVGDGFHTCRIEGCTNRAMMRPTFLFPALDGGSEPIRLETALLDVCTEHSKTEGPETFTANPDIWRTICKVWTDAGMEPPDKRLAKIHYDRIFPEIEYS